MISDIRDCDNWYTEPCLSVELIERSLPGSILVLALPALTIIPFEQNASTTETSNTITACKSSTSDTGHLDIATAVDSSMSTVDETHNTTIAIADGNTTISVEKSEIRPSALASQN